MYLTNIKSAVFYLQLPVVHCSAVIGIKEIESLSNFGNLNDNKNVRLNI